ncbi:MAG TPA: VWA domain-containing protein [Stackebrandtia sp.]|jgi:uncharacterized protein YegL|uniref:VWA domain-containing protein n=1 Tax=Stackebrandtia sp. TaxID=2023065 RepID=UPI002D4E250E|nr:VWA domain-containing protein [Stackebrandtia sp.]HZE37859.1 VWA domain-containing protein [Stackebrandtia sp.]
MSDDGGFGIEVDHNEYMSEGDTVVDAIVTVESTGDGNVEAPAAGAGFVQVIMVDCSGSMIGSRIAEAKRATLAAIDALREGDRFAIIAGSFTGQMVFPAHEGTVAADKATRRAAKRAVDRLQAGGGTAMGTWLEVANRILAPSPAGVKYGLLLSDGHNQHETEEELRAALTNCAGNFVCNSCGIGSEWQGAEMRLIADQLLGTAMGLPDAQHWAEQFTALTRSAMRKTLGDVTLRVFTPARNTIRFIKQMSPNLVDLTGRRAELDGKTGDYPTGTWGAETREFHVSVAVPPIQPNDDRLAARVTLVSGGEELARGMITAHWTGDTLLSTKINPRVAHHTGQAELAAAIQEGVAAAKSGDNETATDKLGRAVELAKEVGNEGTARLLAKVVDVDAATGTVHMKPKVNAVDLEMADVESVKTVTVRKQPDA